MRLQRLVSAFVILLLIAGLIAVRAFEDVLFLDPLKAYFHVDFQLRDIPDVNLLKQIAITSLRFLINTILSLCILWFLYKKASYIKASLWVYLFAFVLLTVAFGFLLEANSDLGKMGLFYVRRFLIHPLLLFVLVAGFYFLKQKNKSLD
jgi:exosortase F-associated protein